MCMISGNGDYASVVAWTTKPKALKEHRCGECREVIKPGETYERVEGVWDGKWLTFKTCSTCVEIRDWFYCDSYTYTQIWGGICEILEEMTPGCLDGLSPAATAAVVELYDDLVEVDQ